MSKEEMENRIKELEIQLGEVKGSECEVYTRIVGYFRPVKQWNDGKQAEYSDRETFVASSMEETARAV